MLATEPKRLHYHDATEFDRFGLRCLTTHAKEYLRFRSTIPVSLTNASIFPPQYFTFSNSLLRYVTINPEAMKKPYEVAVKYGYRGYSKGGKNGIFRMREGDSPLEEACNEMVERNVEQITEDLDVAYDLVSRLEHVKIVWHNTSGERVVGLRNPDNNRIIFLGRASY